MKIYLAAPWVDKDSMPEIAAKIEAIGNEITHRWWDVEGAVEDGSPDAEAYHRHHAELDVQGVKDADIIVVVNTVKSEGKAFEQGVAVAYDRPIIIIGKRGEVSKNVFHYLKNYLWVGTTEEMLTSLKAIVWLFNGVKQVGGVGEV